MKKIYYFFGECGRLTKTLLALGIVSAVIALIFLLKGGAAPLVSDDTYFSLYSAWFLFFLSVSIFSLLADLCVHKICSDVAALLKEIEEGKGKP